MKFSSDKIAYLGQVIFVRTGRGPNHYFTKRFVLLTANTHVNSNR